MKIRIALLWLVAAGAVCGQSVTALRAQGESVEQSADATDGGYLVFRPITYNPYDGATCTDQWTNHVQQPLPASSTVTFGANDLLLWNSLSPSMPFTSGAYGAVQPMDFNTVGAAGPCGSPLPVNTNYGLNTNGYFFARGGEATDNPLYNSIQSLQGGVLAGSFTAAIWYPVGTTICTAYNGSTCTATAVIASGVCPGGSVGCYLGGHVDVGHSVGPPASGGIGSVTNPYTAGEGAVAGQLYWEDGNSVFPTYYPCLRGYNSVTSTFGCVGDVSEIYNSFADRAGSPATTAAFQTSSGTMVIWGSGDAQFQTVKATSTFNSLATGSTAAFQQYLGTFLITGAGNASFQSLALTNGLTVDSGAYGFSAAGALTAASAAATVFNCSATGSANCLQQGSGTFTVTGAGNAAFQSLALTNGLTVDSGAYGLNGSGVLNVASCTGCGSAAVTSWNSRTGAVTLASADVALVEQDLRTSASPTFGNVTASTLLNCGATGGTNCLQQASGTFHVTGSGDAGFQSVAVTNGMTVDSGAYYFNGSGTLSANVISAAGTITAFGEIYAQSNLSVTGVIGVSSGLTIGSGSSGYLQVYGPIEVGSGLAAGVTGSTCSAWINGVCTHL